MWTGISSAFLLFVGSGYRKPFRYAVLLLLLDRLLHRRLDLHLCLFLTLERKEPVLPMSTHTVPIEAPLDTGASPAHRPDRQRGLCLALCRAESLPPHPRLWNGSAAAVRWG